MVSTLQSGGPRPRWAVRATTLLLWGLAIFSAGYWALRVIATPTGVGTAPPALRTPPPANPDAVARLLGAPAGGTATAAPAADLAGRFSLTGVVADRRGQGAALISVDGRPPRPYLVGSQVAEGLIVQSVEGRRVVLAESPGAPRAVVLELPALPR